MSGCLPFIPIDTIAGASFGGFVQDFLKPMRHSHFDSPRSIGLDIVPADDMGTINLECELINDIRNKSIYKRHP